MNLTIDGKQFKIIKSSNVLISKTRLGLEKFWQGHIVEKANGANHVYLTSSYWQITRSGKTSKVQFASPYEVTPKNIGRSNETTVREQANLEFDSMLQKQRDKGYAEKGKSANILTLPMLAQKFKDRSKHVSWPAFVQPKLNGQRMLMDGTKAWSRQGKLFPRECVAHLIFDTKGHTIDGELILPGNQLLQMTSRAAKKFYPKVSPTLLYQVYDVVEPKMDFSERHELLKQLVKNAPKNVILVKTYKAEDPSDITRFHSEFVKNGYEGAMVRNMKGGYQVGHRSNDLQKVKAFQDAEFRILNVLEGDGSDKGLAIFECVTPEGEKLLKKNPSIRSDKVFEKKHIFNCRPEGSRDVRADWYKNKNKLINKYLTVRFFDYTEDNKPFHPVGVDVREKGEF